jgi:hypothetical protein
MCINKRSRPGTSLVKSRIASSFVDILYVEVIESQLFLSACYRNEFGFWKELFQTKGLVPIGYRGALLSTLPHVNVYVTHNLLNVLVRSGEADT